MQIKMAFAVIMMVFMVSGAVAVGMAKQHGQDGQQEKALKPPKNLRIITGPNTSDAPQVKGNGEKQNIRENRQENRKYQGNDKSPPKRRQKEKVNQQKDRQGPEQQEGPARKDGN